jgi:hypothetical protein
VSWKKNSKGQALILVIGVESPLAALLITNLTKHLPATHRKKKNYERGKGWYPAVL